MFRLESINGAINRRLFLGGAVSLSCAAVLHDSVVPRASAAISQSMFQDELVPHMKWMNEPAAWKVADGKITVRSEPKTDFWRKTFYGYITDNGHFFHLSVEGEFTFEVRVGGQYAALYDQAGLMVRVDAENWVKCGTEFR
jgi:hypothetical protein